MAARRSSKQGAKGSPAEGKATTGAPEGAAGGPAASNENHEFVAEAEEILERMLEDLAELHDQRHESASGEVDPDLVNQIFRSAHSLKGLAGMFGLDAISELSHRLEDILDGLRLGKVAFDSPAVDLLDDGVSLLTTMMTRLERGDANGDDEVEMARGFVAQIDAAIAGAVPEPSDDLESLDLDASLLRALTEYEEHRLKENLRRGRHLALVDSTFEIAAFEEGLSELSAAVREVGEVVSTLPSPGDAPESQIRFSLLVATSVDAARLASRLDFPDTEVHLVKEGDASAEAPPAESPAPPSDASQPASTEAPAPAGPSASEPSPPADGGGDAPEIESLRSISDTVRVDIRKLDELMNLVGELVIQRNAIGTVAQRLTEDVATARIGAELAKTHKALDRKLKELQTGVLDVRMVPLRQIFEKLSRVVRRLRRDLGKEVDLEFVGADTELDKLIVEQLVDPLVHIVRNAFDHALETPEERTAAGKDPHGRITVAASQRGNHVVIEVQDDGRGMDPAAILEKAIARGLVAESDQLSEKEILNLVFEAGLSTASQISATSGRGVGMDVVRNNLAEMGGMVDLASTPGRGTTVTITLPITLAIIQALIVAIREERFAIPLNSVLETMVVEPDQIGRSEGREVLNLRGEPLLLRRLGEEFEIPCAGPEERQFVVVLGMGEQRLGLLVDRLEGQQDTVIKPIKGPLQQIRGIAGATELADRGAILVIDVSAIVGDVIRRREAA
ncbi:MAG: chemotaxis protein CheA [bacterium]|nr:chemotaxis protein CheA [bacterium]